MARLAVVDLRKVLGAIERMDASERAEAARALRTFLARFGAQVMGAPDECVGCDCASLVRRLGSTISYLRGMEASDWQRPAPVIVDGADITNVRLDPAVDFQREPQKQAEEHGRKAKGKATD